MRVFCCLGSEVGQLGSVSRCFEQLAKRRKHDPKSLGDCILKMIPKPSKNASILQPKRLQNSGPEAEKARSRGTKIEVQRAPGQVWKRLGLSWAIQSVFGGVLGRLGSVLERFWRRLGPSWGPTWVQVAPQDATKIDKKSIPKLINFLMPLEIGFWTGVQGFLIPKWS